MSAKEAGKPVKSTYRCAKCGMRLKRANATFPKKFMRGFSFKKIIFFLFRITETTDKGKKWKRIAADNRSKWLKIVKLSDYRLEVNTG
ncbi:MAG TPA: hypothetical protein VNJ07_04335 [Chitinophagales bacterium]|nr:hypothetical protein [Chitinophagales bacterium]